MKRLVKDESKCIGCGACVDICPNSVFEMGDDGKAKVKNGVFHPKLFMFKNDNKGIIISGSANITKGGLISNQEVSLVSETKISSTDWKASLKSCTNCHASWSSYLT